MDYKRKVVYSLMFSIVFVLFVSFVSAGFWGDTFLGPSDTTDVDVTVGNVIPTIVTAPVIANVDLTPYDPLLNPTGLTSVSFSFVATDPNGVGTLDDSTATASFTFNAVTRNDALCDESPPSTSGSDRTYFCSIDFNFYDEEADWVITVSVDDTNAATGSDNSNVVHVNLLKDISLTSGTPINFGSVAPGQANVQPTSGAVEVRNNGNYDANTISITGNDLEDDTESDIIPATSFTSSGTNEADVCGAGTSLSTSAVTIPSSDLPRGAIGSNLESDLKFCLQVPGILATASYSTTEGVDTTAWTIGI
jgi:hypothetical protein